MYSVKICKKNGSYKTKQKVAYNATKNQNIAYTSNRIPNKVDFFEYSDSSNEHDVKPIKKQSKNSNQNAPSKKKKFSTRAKSFKMMKKEYSNSKNELEHNIHIIILDIKLKERNLFFESATILFNLDILRKQQLSNFSRLDGRIISSIDA